MPIGAVSIPFLRCHAQSTNRRDGSRGVGNTHDRIVLSRAAASIAATELHLAPESGRTHEHSSARLVGRLGHACELAAPGTARGGLLGAILRSDPRTLIGAPIVALLIAFLATPEVRSMLK